MAFRDARDYQYFLGQMKEFVLPIADVYVYSLTPKKFQFLMCIKSKNQVCKSIGLDEDSDYHLEKQNQIILGQFEMILENYTSYFRQNTNEKTSVFGKFLQRIQIDEEKDLIIHSGEMMFNVVMKSGDVLILFPEDVHKSGLKREETGKVRKLVFKVPVESL